MIVLFSSGIRVKNVMPHQNRREDQGFVISPWIHTSPSLCSVMTNSGCLSGRFFPCCLFAEAYRKFWRLFAV